MFSFRPRSSKDDKTPVSISIIGAGTVITGNIESSGDIRIDGILKGNLFCNAKVLIGADAIIEGDVTGRTGNILGKVEGNIHMRELLFLHGKAIVQGDIHAGQLQIEPLVTFNGQCHMSASVVEFNTNVEIPMSISKAVNE